MWFFHKRKVSVKGLLNGGTDYHSHILPGVDDGVQSMEEALEILCMYETIGVKALWLTPHIMEDIPNTTTRLKERFAELQSVYSGTVQLNLAAEYMLDSVFEERLANNDLLPLGEQGNHLLVETSYFTPPMGLHNTLRRIQAKGYYPVLAHPERYMYMGSEEYKQLKEMQVKFQLNVFSLSGGYGSVVKRKALSLQKQSMYEMNGSDVHSAQMVKKYLI